MIAKLLGQFVIVTLMTHMLPVDASFYEYNAGVTTQAGGQASFVLPESDDRELPQYPVKVATDSYAWQRFCGY